VLHTGNKLPFLILVFRIGTKVQNLLPFSSCVLQEHIQTFDRKGRDGKEYITDLRRY